MPEASAMPPEYMKPMQSTMAAYGKSAGGGQTPEEQFPRKQWASGLMISGVTVQHSTTLIDPLYLSLGFLRMINIHELGTHMKTN